jgi:hypothetical protein
MRVGVGERTIDQHRQHHTGNGEATGKEQDQCGALAGRAEGSASHYHSAFHLLHMKPKCVFSFKLH